MIGRFTMDLLGPVPVGELAVDRSCCDRAGPSRSGRPSSATNAAGSWRGPRAGHSRTVWPRVRVRVGLGVPLEHGPADGHHEDPPASWSRGYLDSVEWRGSTARSTQPGPAVVWMRPLVPLVPGEEMSPLQRLLTCVDSASGASAALDLAEWNFMNTELSVHLVRPPVGEWVCLRAETTLATGAVGLAASEVYDENGLVARSAQALLVSRVRGARASYELAGGARSYDARGQLDESVPAARSAAGPGAIRRQ